MLVARFNWDRFDDNRIPVTMCEIVTIDDPLDKDTSDKWFKEDLGDGYFHVYTVDPHGNRLYLGSDMTRIVCYLPESKKPTRFAMDDDRITFVDISLFWFIGVTLYALDNNEIITHAAYVDPRSLIMYNIETSTINGLKMDFVEHTFSRRATLLEHYSATN
jgi:hypothetical protein